MKKESKRRAVGGAVYVFCALMLVTILCAAWMTALGGANRGYTKIEVPATTSAKDKAAPKETEPAETTTAAADTTDPAETAAEPEGAAEPASALPEVFFMPVEGVISKGFNNELAVYSATMNDYRAHCGVDVDAAVGTAVGAFADGTVESVGRDRFMGCTVCVDHGGGMKSYYMNLAEDLPDGITVGSNVLCGQTVGYVGATAAAEAADPPHLHFEVTVNGARVDPLGYAEYEEEGDE